MGASGGSSDIEVGVGTKLDRYELQSRIGSGGMGLIFRGFDTKLKRTVAVKIVSDRVKEPEVRKTIHDRFLNEARAAGGLSHPNLVQIYDFGEFHEMAYIVMEYIEGETLEELLKRKQQLNLEELLRLTKEVSSGLTFAHKRGIVHRDIKPSNIILEANTGIAKILDFGIAKFVDQEEMKLTSTGMVLGSTHYLSPEHITGRNLDRRSDIFSLGTVLYESATGSLPFRGTNSSSILYKIVHFDPQPIGEVRPELNTTFVQLVEKCLKKNPDERYQGCDEIEKHIYEIQNTLVSDRRQRVSTSEQTPLPLKSYFVRDSQLVSVLRSQNKLNPEQLLELKGKPAAETILRENWLSEDELSKVIADCLDLPWVPRGRLKSIKILDAALNTLSRETLGKFNVIPFYKDDEKKVISFLIDGSSDFQRAPDFNQIAANYQIQYYVAGSISIRRMLDGKIKQQDSGADTNARPLLMDAEDLSDAEYLSRRRVLFVDKQNHHHEALIRLFKKSENALTIAADLSEALVKIANSEFDFVWVDRNLVGDELDFELQVLKQNPSCEIRYFESLAHELFQESVTYRKVRDQLKKWTTFCIQTGGSGQQQRESQEFAALALRLAFGLTENERIKDEVFYSALFWKFEQLTNKAGQFAELLDGVLRMRYVRDCLQERFDGRGPMGLRSQQIPLAARVLVVLFVIESVRRNWKSGWTPEEFATLKDKFDQYSNKQLDPMITANVMELLAPKDQDRSQLCKVAIVDSDSKYSAQLASQLKSIAKPTVYADGVAALAGIKKDKPDLIVSEILLSKLDGFSLCARLQADASLKQIPLVFVSESSSPEHSTRAIQLGAEDFIPKSSEPRFILAKIEKMLSKKTG